MPANPTVSSPATPSGQRTSLHLVSCRSCTRDQPNPPLNGFLRSSQRTNRSLLRTPPRLRQASTTVKQPRWLVNAMRSSQRPFHLANTHRLPVTPLFRGVSSQPANLQTCRSPSGHTQSPQRVTFCMNSRSTRTLASEPCRQRMRSQLSALPSVRRSPGISGSRRPQAPASH